jgi:chondroitin AC lyase
MQKPEGQNLVWFAEQLMVRGVLTNFSQDISNAASIIENSVSIKGEDGSIQPDFSFHQHGNLLYNGGYGQGFLTDSLQFAAALQGTQFAFTQDKLDILSDFLLQGSRLMMRGHMLDYGAIGREISRKEGGREADRFVTACEELARMEPDKAQEYAAL